MDNTKLLEVINRVLANGIRPDERVMIQWKAMPDVNPTFDVIKDGPINFTVEGGTVKMNNSVVYVESSDEYAVLVERKKKLVR